MYEFYICMIVVTNLTCEIFVVTCCDVSILKKPNTDNLAGP